MWLPARIPKHNRNTPLVLRIVDADTRFKAATLLYSERATSTLAIRYEGMPQSMLTDQGSVFISDE